MTDQKYIYRGPLTGVTIRTGEGKQRKTRDVTLIDGAEVELPPDHPYVKRLAALGRLVQPRTAGNADPTSGSRQEPPKKAAAPTVNSEGKGKPTVTGKEPV
jgi:hypothetical protein